MKAQRAIAYLQSMPPDEPVFVLRAQDRLAADVVDTWCDHAEIAGVRSGKVAEGRDCGRDMRAWPTTKTPD